MEALFETIAEKTRVSPELKVALEHAFVQKKISKNEILLNEGQYCKKLYFLEKGTIRSFYQDKKIEVTTWFYKEGNFFSSWYAFYTGQAGYESIEAVEDCVVYVIQHDKYEELLNEHPEFERFARIMAEQLVALTDSFSKGYLFMSAKEKYDLILNYFPDIEQRVKLGQLASFLGISQETLSRIRGIK